MDSEQTDALRELAGADGGPARMMVIGEDWCGDVVRELPALARVAEAAGLDLRIFPRDENHDIMNEFLKEGKYMSIPVAVFYDRGHEYICHWIERSAVANREQGEIEAGIRAEQPDISDQDFGRQRRARTAVRAGEWQKATVDELVGNAAGTRPLGLRRCPGSTRVGANNYSPLRISAGPLFSRRPAPA